MDKNYNGNHSCDHEGCNHDHDHDHDVDIIYLTLDDGEELECEVIGFFEVEDVEYIALVPVDDDQVFLYRYEEYEDGFDLINIEDDEEFDIVSEAFYALFAEDLEDEFGYDELYEDYDDEDEI
ncbi:MAG: DUF1292 domain-containing protein [Tissierellia bacterium]|mgnify:CR=1 FL=1|nr:DUF1292 domain-containing protein [Tissierellia bacterium]